MLAKFSACLVAVAAAATVVQGAPSTPHIVYLLVDDWGWADVGYHRPPGYKEISTPNMDALVQVGVELDNHHSYKFCSPTRSAIQCGRNPIHANVQNVSPFTWNEKNKLTGYSGVPPNMTGMGAVLKQAGYATHAVGKWDAGMATPEQSPKGRGYDTSLIYYGHQNDYWTFKWTDCGGIYDLWTHNETFPGGDAHDLANPANCVAPNNIVQPVNMTGCVYEEKVLSDYVENVISTHDVSTPLFMFWATHSIHAPYQIPQYWEDKFSFINETNRRRYHAMVHYVDSALGNVTQLLKDRGMWDDTLLVVTSDNGGPIYYHPGDEHGYGGANNYPMRGGKGSNFQGGMRVNAFVSGGFVPEAQHGKKLTGLGAVWDWYSTFAGITGVDPTDHSAAAAGLPPVDGVNLWPYVSGEVATSPRTELPIGSTATHHDIWGAKGDTTVEGYIWDDGNGSHWKLLMNDIPMNIWTGEVYPNTSSKVHPTDHFLQCGTGGCLFDVLADPGEHTDLAQQRPDIVETLMGKLMATNATVFAPDRGSTSKLACQIAVQKYGGYGPFTTE